MAYNPKHRWKFLMHKPQKGVVPRANVILTASKGIIGNYSAVSRYSRAKLRAFPPSCEFAWRYSIRAPKKWQKRLYLPQPSSRPHDITTWQASDGLFLCKPTSLRHSI